MILQDSPFRKLGNTEAQAISEKEVPRENDKEQGTNSGLEPLTPIQTSNPPTSQTASPPPSESSLTHLSSHSGHLSSGISYPHRLFLPAFFKESLSEFLSSPCLPGNCTSDSTHNLLIAISFIPLLLNFDI